MNQHVHHHTQPDDQRVRQVWFRYVQQRGQLRFKLRQPLVEGRLQQIGAPRLDKSLNQFNLISLKRVAFAGIPAYDTRVMGRLSYKIALRKKSEKVDKNRCLKSYFPGR